MTMIPHMNPHLDFEDAFGTARARGAAAFLWRGKVYHMFLLGMPQPSGWGGIAERPQAA